MGKIKSVKIVYFSGTGGTTRAAACFDASFRKRGVKTNNLELTMSAVNRDYLASDNLKEDLLVLLYPVHAFNAPEPIYKWIDEKADNQTIRAVVISVSGGGEITPNKACRLACIKRLEKKGYNIVYEHMLIMPSNVIIGTAYGYALGLLEILPLKVDCMVNEILLGIRRRTRPDLLNRLFSKIGELEKPGARFMGSKMQVSEACNLCGWCEANCPLNNITLGCTKPYFSNNCILCMRCIYGCPKRAIMPGLMKFMAIKEGYNLCDLERIAKVQVPLSKRLPHGFLWKGIREYLFDSDK